MMGVIEGSDRDEDIAAGTDPEGTVLSPGFAVEDPVGWLVAPVEIVPEETVCIVTDEPDICWVGSMETVDAGDEVPPFGFVVGVAVVWSVEPSETVPCGTVLPSVS